MARDTSKRDNVEGGIADVVYTPFPPDGDLPSGLQTGHFHRTISAQRAPKSQKFPGRRSAL